MAAAVVHPAPSLHLASSTTNKNKRHIDVLLASDVSKRRKAPPAPPSPRPQPGHSPRSGGPSVHSFAALRINPQSSPRSSTAGSSTANGSRSTSSKGASIKSASSSSSSSISKSQLASEQAAREQREALLRQLAAEQSRLHGSIRVAQGHFCHAVKAGVCSLCHSQYSTPQEKNVACSSLYQKLGHLKGREKHVETIVSTLHMLGGSAATEPVGAVSKNSPKNSPKTRSGYVDYFRWMRADTLKTKQCPLCTKPLANTAPVLSTLDRFSYLANQRFFDVTDAEMAADDQKREKAHPSASHPSASHPSASHAPVPHPLASHDEESKAP